MSSSFLLIPYYSASSPKPTIINPKTDAHWSSSKNIVFTWKYNGRDTQMGYQIQIFNINHTYLDDEDFYELWNTETILDNSSAICTEAFDGALCVYDSGEIVSSLNTLTIDLTSLIDDDGIYLWRVKTQGFISRGWSYWANDGYVRIDSVSPIIKNILVETKYSDYKSISTISDFSSPYLYRKRTVGSSTVYDTGIDDAGSPSLYIYYDYKDNSLILRTKGDSTTSRRYYGMLSFHANNDDREEPDPYFYPQEIIDNIYTFYINRENNEYGPFEQTEFVNEISSGFYPFPFLENILLKETLTNGTNAFVPKGFPSFTYNENSIYNDIITSNHPCVKASSSNFFSIFPLNTFLVSANKAYKFPGMTLKTRFSTYGYTGNLIEMRYPPPFQDVFILFNLGMTKILAYGQYKNWDDVYNSVENPLDETTTFELYRGWNVEGNRAYKKYPDTSTWEIFNSNDEYNVADNNPYGSINTRLYKITDSAGTICSMPRSYYLYFNLNTETDKDNGIKIHLNKNAVRYPEKSFNFYRFSPNTDFGDMKLDSIEFHMYPETDCLLSSDSSFGSSIPVDEIKIGRAQISPRDLSSFNTNNYDSEDDGKKYYKNIKVSSSLSGQKISSKEFKISENDFDDEIVVFENSYDVDDDEYSNLRFNGSFRLKIPEYDFVPYYLPNAFSILDEAETDLLGNPVKAPIPYIYDADPNPDETTNVVNWDSIRIRTYNITTIVGEFFTSVTFPINGLINYDYIYPNDVIQFIGPSKMMNQYSPYLSNIIKWSQLSDSGSSSSPIGKMLNHSIFNNYNGSKSLYDYGGLGETYYYDGFSRDGIYYNRENLSLYFIANKTLEKYSATGSAGETILKIKDFSNLLFRKHVSYKFSDSVSDSEDYTYYINPDTDTSTLYSFGGEFNVIENNAYSTGENGPSWVYNEISDTIFKKALILSENSIQGNFGSEGSTSEDWILRSGIGNSFGGYYLLRTIGYGEYNSEQILRMVSNYPEIHNTLMFRGELDRESYSEDQTGIISGDTFALGNIFGYVYPENSSVRIFFDVDEETSGVNEYRYFIQEVTVSDVDIESSQYIGNIDKSGYEKNKISMQTLNNKTLNYLSIPGSPAYPYLTLYRTPNAAIEYYMENNAIASQWKTISNSRDLLDDQTGVGYGINRLYADIVLPGFGYKNIYVQVRDKSGNTSGIHPVSVNKIDQQITRNEIVSATCMVDDSNITNRVIDTISDGTTNYYFSSSYYFDDDKNNKSIVVSNLLYNDSDEYLEYERTNDLLMGFSDNYGLYYNSFVPFSSINSWDFSRPISIDCKSFQANQRYSEPDWYFDPNHVRFYTPDTTDEIALNIVSPYSVGNSGIENITLIGLMEEEVDDTLYNRIGKSSPIANKIYENREEFIGKKLIFGSDLSSQYTILHIFRSDSLSPSKRKSSSGTITTIDGDGYKTGSNYATIYSQRKIWIVIEDVDAKAALLASRKFQYYTKNNISSDLFSQYKEFTGWREYRSVSTAANANIDYTQNVNYIKTDPFGNKTVNFGYPEESQINELILSSVDDSLYVADGEIPEEVPYSDYYEWQQNNIKRLTMYISPTLITEKVSGISSGEGWITQIFKRYSNDGYTGDSVYDNLTNSNIVGIEVLDSLVFGKNYYVEADIKSIDLGENAIFIENGRLDYTFGYSTQGFEYSIIRISDDVVMETGTISSVSDDGLCAVVTSSLNFDPLTVDYKIKVTVPPLQSTDSSGNIRSIGWWPEVDGYLLTPNSSPVGSTVSESQGQQVKFATISMGSFYVRESGEYSFKVDSDSLSSCDFCVDYMRQTDRLNSVEGIVYSGGEYVDANIGGILNKDDTNGKTFYLKKGWHIGRFRYVSNTSSTLRYACLYFKRAGWETNSWVPFVGSRDPNKPFMKKGFRTIHGKIIDKDYNKYPLDDSSLINANSESQYFRAITAFDGLDSETQQLSYKNRIAWIKRISEDTSSSSYNYGKVYQSSRSDSRTYSGQVFEEAYGVYDSNIFDGGLDIKFWKSISWSPSEQPDYTSVEVYVRTGSTEQELLSRKWNDIGVESENILSVFTNPAGNDITKFSHQNSSINAGEIIINRFIQFRMVLKSRVYNQVPRVDDVTITYSKENSVNFYTTTFNLNSNIVRALLTYNGSGAASDSDTALTDIQFGICTEEVTDGVVSTNFDNYTIIPVNEAFDLSSMGIAQNDKFRIGIRFISSSEDVPSVDEFGLMWQSDSDQTQTKDI